MIIKTSFIDNTIEVDNEYIRCLEIENKTYFYRFLDSLNRTINGDVLDELFLIDINQNNINLITDYLNLNYNSRKIINDINKLIKEKFSENDYDELTRRSKKVMNIFKRVIGDINIPISIVEDTNIEGLIKLLNVTIKFSDDLLTNLLILIDTNRELNNKNILVFVNLKQYLTKSELQELYKYAIYNNQIMMLIDSQSYGVCSEYEKKILIDDELEEYVL